MNQRPFWVFIPYINNRTAWRPISFPAVLIIPFGADDKGRPLAQSAPRGISVSILDTTRRNRVSGPFAQGLYFPARELFTLALNSSEIADRRIDTHDFPISVDPTKGEILTITNRMGVIGDVPYIPNSLYYDLSDIAIDVEDLQSGRYQLSYQAVVDKRIYDNNGILVCIDHNDSDTAVQCVDFSHPGEVIDEMKKNTPSIWFSGASLAEDPLITIYKPLSDSLQNVYDEQTLLSRINLVNAVFPETVPYLGRILGWEIPYFPQSLDPLRRSVLRTTTEFQKKRGTFKGITELFDLFGFNILIRNLWTAIDNQTLLEPRYDGINGVTLIDTPTVDVLSADMRAPGFYQQKISLLRRPASKSAFDNFVQPGSELTLHAYAVHIDSPANAAIQAYLTTINIGMAAKIKTTPTGFVNNDLENLLNGLDVWASQSIHLDRAGQVQHNTAFGARRILHADSTTVNFTDPSISIKLDGNWADDQIAIYVFANYYSQQVVPDPALIERRSNYFDIRLATTVDASLSTNLILDYALEFLYRIKAMHSLLRQVYITAESPEVYLVTDYCYGPGLSRQFDSDIGKQQVPPAIIPVDNSEDECADQNANLSGYKESDIAYRDRITSGLMQEWLAWVSYDDREIGEVDHLKMVPQIPDASRTQARYNEYGQDAFIKGYVVHQTMGILTPDALANQNAQTIPTQYFLYNTGLLYLDNKCVGYRHYGTLHHYTPYTPAPDLQAREPICFRGRVGDEMVINSRTSGSEWYSPGSCSSHMGRGTYFTTPRTSTIVNYGSSGRSSGSLTPRPIISSGRNVSGEYFDDVWIDSYSRLAIDPRRLSGSSNRVLHYWDRAESLDASWSSAAIEVVDLGVQYTNMHFPGTRFIGMNDYDGTFVSATYRLRPWDVDVCDNGLQTRLEWGTNDSQYLEFIDTPFVVNGNGRPADVPVMDVNTTTVIDPDMVVQAIWSQFATAEESIHRPWDTGIISNNGTITLPPGSTIDDAIFPSASVCSGNIIDYADGYPSVTGLMIIAPDFGDSPYYTPPVAMPTAFLFFSGSGIIDGSRGIRLDCDCLSVPCDLSPPSLCAMTQDADSLVAIPIMVLRESMGAQEWRLDGSIPSMLELIEI